ncbi:MULTISPECIES: S8 family serine peptidase [Nocardioides]|uniref:S8 family serine peptidase n=1 Tax=Nocardioides vastitatis TaxID=2568655 RepID=A0ABW0ZI22_9ACTN|nr:S8 family serine peptidase [Nocardioides sp.]
MSVILTTLGIAAAAAAGTHITTEEPQALVAEQVTGRVVVIGPDAAASAREVRAAGGTVRAEVELINGVVAELPRGAELPGGYDVVPDRPVSFASEASTADPQRALVRETVGLASTGSEGAGVTVALVDTGVADVSDLAGRLDHIDVTGTGVGDDYGHGTYLAGVLAGSGESSDGRFQGVAPQARVLDVKVADGSGRTSLALVLEGLQQVWNTADQYGTKVVNLSLASGSPLPYQVDPLNQALRRLWHRGFTVVVASGNDGPTPGVVASPGNDPVLLTAGGLDDGFSASRADDTVAEFSGRGPTIQGVGKPDLVAPGVHVVGLRAPGSHVDVSFPRARVAADYVRGSGTSASAAVTSAAVATILADSPNLRPAQIKHLVTATAYQADALRTGAGAGGIDLQAALQMADSPKIRQFSPPVANVPGTPGQWRSVAIAIGNGDRKAAAAAWKQLSPEARAWVGRSWVKLDPVARAWVGRSWVTSSGDDEKVTSEEWAARAWVARAWVGDAWAARAWVGDDWAGRAWIGDDWAARAWVGDDWAGRAWIGEIWEGRAWVVSWR